MAMDVLDEHVMRNVIMVISLAKNWRLENLSDSSLDSHRISD